MNAPAARNRRLHGRAGDFAGRSDDFAGRAGDFAGRSVDFAGRAGDFAGRSVDFAGRAVDFAGRAVDFAGRAVDFVGRSVDFAGRSVDFAGRSVDFAGRSGDFAGRAGEAAERVVLLGTFAYSLAQRVALEAGEPVRQVAKASRRSGDAGLLSREREGYFAPPDLFILVLRVVRQGDFPPIQINHRWYRICGRPESVGDDGGAGLLSTEREGYFAPPCLFILVLRVVRERDSASIRINHQPGYRS